MTTVPTSIPSRTQVVLEGIKHRILTGQLRPGQALVESELAGQVGVSKTPVREALKTLAGTGLVEMNLYKGVTVRQVDADMAREVYDVRLLLEPEALRRTVRRSASLDAAHEALARADAATDAAERSLAQPRVPPRPVRAVRQSAAREMLDEVRDQAALVSAVAWAADPSWDREAAEHARILHLAAAGDADGAADALHRHIASFVARSYPPHAAPSGGRGPREAHARAGRGPRRAAAAAPRRQPPSPPAPAGHRTRAAPLPAAGRDPALSRERRGAGHPAQASPHTPCDGGRAA